MGNIKYTDEGMSSGSMTDHVFFFNLYKTKKKAKESVKCLSAIKRNDI